VSAGTSGLMTGVRPTLHASVSRTAHRLVVKPSMPDSAPETCVKASAIQVSSATSSSSSGKSTFGSMPLTSCLNGGMSLGSSALPSLASFSFPPTTSSALLPGSPAATWTYAACSAEASSAR